MSLELDKPCTMRDRTYRYATTLALYPVDTRVGPEPPPYFPDSCAILLLSSHPPSGERLLYLSLTWQGP
jgi:hypothetical protein